MLIIKIGGGKKIDWKYICEDLVEVVKKRPVVIIHGANAKRDEIAQRLGVATRLITSPSGIQSVYTDQKALDTLLMVYAGLVNKQIVARMQSYGLNAVGLTGIDGLLWQAKWKKDLFIKEKGKVKLLKGSFTGRIEKVNSDLLTALLDKGFIPVLSAPAISYEYQIVNIDNDWAAAMTASALKIKKIVNLFEAPGLLRDVADKNSVISSIKKDELDQYMEYAKGRMKKKILGTKKALELGVEKVYWGDGRIKDPVTSCLSGKGTVIK